MLNLSRHFIMGVTFGIRADLFQYGVVQRWTKQKLVGM